MVDATMRITSIAAVTVRCGSQVEGDRVLPSSQGLDDS